MMKFYANLFELTAESVSYKSIRRLRWLTIGSLPYLPMIAFMILHGLPKGYGVIPFMLGFVFFSVLTMTVLLARIVNRVWAPDTYLDEWEKDLKRTSMTKAFMAMMYAAIAMTFVWGLFLSIDPVTFMDTGKPAMFNRYSYVHNDPINGIDPFGLECYSVASGADNIGGSACDTHDELNEAIGDSLPDNSSQEYGGYTFAGNVEVFENDDFGNADNTSTDVKTLFYYTQVDGDAQSVDLGSSNPAGALTAWHSHPKFVSDGAGGMEEGFGTEFFSATLSHTYSRQTGEYSPGRAYSRTEGDIAFAHQRNIPFTLFTPQGGIKTASPSQISPQFTTEYQFHLRYSGKQ